MKDTLAKMRALLDMKTCLLNVFRADNKALKAKCEELQTALDVVSKELVILRQQAEPWWKAMDDELSRLEAEEAEYDVDIPFEVTKLTGVHS